MDTSKQYIKMCDCVEVQNFRLPKVEEMKDGRIRSDWGFGDGDTFVLRDKGKVQGGRAKLIFLYTDGGRFNSALSCLRTLQDWKVIGTGKAIKYNGDSMSEDKWVTNYMVNRGGLRKAIHKTLEDEFVKRHGVTKSSCWDANEEEES